MLCVERKNTAKRKNKIQLCPTEKVLLKKFLFLNTGVYVRVAPCVECDVCKNLCSRKCWKFGITNNNTGTNII